MAILIETMRREGFELCVGRPRILFKEEAGKVLEPIEHLYIDCDEQYFGIINERLSSRKAKMVNLVNHGTGRVRVEFSVPSRALIGYRNDFLTDTRGTGIMNSYLIGYEPFRGDFPIITRLKDPSICYEKYKIFLKHLRSNKLTNEVDPELWQCMKSVWIHPLMQASDYSQLFFQYTAYQILKIEFNDPITNFTQALAVMEQKKQRGEKYYRFVRHDLPKPGTGDPIFEWVKTLNRNHNCVSPVKQHYDYLSILGE